jgi:lipid A 4'-phosphatase
LCSIQAESTAAESLQFKTEKILSDTSMPHVAASQKKVFALLLLASLLAAALPAIWPSLDIAAAAFFLQANPPLNPSQWYWVYWVNEYTPDIFRVLVMLCVIAWLIATLTPRLRRFALAIAFVGLSVALGPGLTTYMVKEHQLRARPFDVVEFGGARQFTPALTAANQCVDNCAFVSGHVACGFFFASLMLLDARRRWWWITAGVSAGLLIGLARMVVGAHWLSDVLWAFPITLFSSWIVWNFLALFYHSPAGQIHSNQA